MSAPAWSGSSGADHPAQGGLVRVSAAELDTCFELLGFAGTPPLLQLPSPGRSGRERQHHLDPALVALRRRGLAEASGPNETLAGLVRVLHRPERQLDLSLHAGAQGALVATGAARRGYGALAVRQGEQVALASLPPSELVRAVVGLIWPDAPRHGPVGECGGRGVRCGVGSHHGRLAVDDGRQPCPGGRGPVGRVGLRTHVPGHKRARTTRHRVLPGGRGVVGSMGDWLSPHGGELLPATTPTEPVRRR